MNVSSPSLSSGPGLVRGSGEGSCERIRDRGGIPMTQYMLSVHGVVGEDDAPTDPAELQKIYDDVDAFNDKVREAGAWVFGGGLLPVEAATCVDNTTGQNLVTDGPFAESK